jgi:putative ABC transport system substrate-binding protein
MQRREFIAGLGSVAAWPLAARAQRPGVPVIGWLGSESREADQLRVTRFRQASTSQGYVEGRNLTIEYRYADSQYDRLPALAADLIRRQVNVIASVGLPSTDAAKAATTTIPVVFVFAGDPVEVGVVASLSRPVT